MASVAADTLTTYSKRSPDAQAIQWLPDGSNTLAILTNFLDAILDYNVNGTITTILFQNTEGANLKTFPGYWFVLEADGRVDALGDDVFRKLYNVK